MLASVSTRKNDLPLYLPTRVLVFRPLWPAQPSLQEFVDVRPVVAIAIGGVGTEVVLQDSVGYVDGIINNSNLCSTKNGLCIGLNVKCSL
jgi:hypothetical protein